MLAYIADNFEWTDAQARCINYQAIGIAKKRLNDLRSILTSQLMHGWLNLGVQKERMGDDPTCPCCGRCDEDSLHLYQCENLNMMKAFTDQMAKMKEALIKDRVPRAIVDGFMGMIYKSAHQDPPYYIGNESPLVQAAIESQESLGMEAILRGFHHMQWVEVITKLWQQPQARRYGSTPKCKHPTELVISLVTQTWDLFEIMWAKRNEILHGPETALIDKVDRECTNRFLKFKRHQDEWI